MRFAQGTEFGCVYNPSQNCLEAALRMVTHQFPSSPSAGAWVEWLGSQRTSWQRRWLLMAGYKISVQGQRTGRVGEYGQSKAAHGRKGKTGRAKIKKGKELSRVLL